MVLAIQSRLQPHSVSLLIAMCDTYPLQFDHVRGTFWRLAFVCYASLGIADRSNAIRDTNTLVRLERPSRAPARIAKLSQKFKKPFIQTGDSVTLARSGWNLKMLGKIAVFSMFHFLKL